MEWSANILRTCHNQSSQSIIKHTNNTVLLLLIVDGELGDAVEIEEDEPISSDEEDLAVPNIPVVAQSSVVVSSYNASNITAAVRDSGMQHLRCFVHTLNLSVQLFVKSINMQLANLRPIIRFFQKSPGADSKLKVRVMTNCCLLSVAHDIQGQDGTHKSRLGLDSLVA